MVIGPLGTNFSEMWIKKVIRGNTFEIVVCEMAGILSSGRRVDKQKGNYWICSVLIECCSNGVIRGVNSKRVLQYVIPQIMCKYNIKSDGALTFRMHSLNLMLELLWYAWNGVIITITSQLRHNSIFVGMSECSKSMMKTLWRISRILL